ncbi:MAG: hypothetical protein F6K07_32240, partial [Okeania sp. SIO1H5]|uniref:peptidylprolyl isomerase n=1 Tax=Okeania sp. SIO1H5 TaxID=2607777 RepID=UPI0013BBAC50
LAFAFIVSPLSVLAKQKASNPTVIKVGKTSITKNQVDTLVGLIALKRYGKSEIDPKQREVLRKLVANNMVSQELLQLEANEKKIQASQAEVDSLFKIFRGNYPSQKQFIAALLEAGDTEKSLRVKLRRQLRVDKLLDGRLPHPEPPNKKEMEAYFKEHKKKFPVHNSLRASQILLKVPSKASERVVQGKLAELEKMRNQMMKETEIAARLVLFTRKAIAHSESPEGKKGGDLQKFHPKDFMDEFRNNVKSLKVGEISPAFRTSIGVHLVLLTEKYDGNFENYQLQIAQLLSTRKAMNNQKTLENYLRELVKKYPVEYLDVAYKGELPLAKK